MSEKKASEYDIISSIELMAELEQRKESEERLLSNLPSLDKATEGFLPGELIIISGPTKNGKTLLSMSLTNEFTKQNTFPLWFPYEMPPKYFFTGFPRAAFILSSQKNENAHNGLDYRKNE